MGNIIIDSVARIIILDRLLGPGLGLGLGLGRLVGPATAAER